MDSVIPPGEDMKYELIFFSLLCSLEEPFQFWK